MGPADEIESKLQDLNFVNEFDRVNTVDGLFSYRIASEKGSNPAEELFQFVVQNGWSLTELRQESVSLEDVFRELTGESANKEVAA